MALSFLAVDMGMTNIDLILDAGPDQLRCTLTNQHGGAADQLRQALQFVQPYLPADAVIGVTGGRYRDLSESVDGYPIKKVDEITALGLGGLAVAGLKEGLIVSAGTGTAMVAARPDSRHHVTGSAVGGGTLIGLAKLILGTNDIHEIDQLALQGDAGQVDIMLSEAVGGEVGRLPAFANAVNLGKVDRKNGFSQENLAAGLVRLVAQVIAVIAINAANAESMRDIILIGHLMDLESICQEIRLVGAFYQRSFIIPEEPGFGTVTGVLEALRRVSFAH